MGSLRPPRWPAAETSILFHAPIQQGSPGKGTVIPGRSVQIQAWLTHLLLPDPPPSLAGPAPVDWAWLQTKLVLVDSVLLHLH